ncbi:uncharacterized protein YALI1_E19783g [Yarrowia lipolytica]|uniref:Uncharacterized protein n=1 Tax=Yarrowia lipolytica TaxID=4952 RepID=A0A1D8NIP3_YARLL|nr:hypothetical protein YALI1_E19783g [Yarrowia lipolytica]
MNKYTPHLTGEYPFQSSTRDYDAWGCNITLSISPLSSPVLNPFPHTHSFSQAVESVESWFSTQLNSWKHFRSGW